MSLHSHELGEALVAVFLGGLRDVLFQILYLLAPFFLVGLFLHGVERLVQRNLSRYFGWGSVLWTGWLGTPVHELSHAAACLLFFHRIDEMALFRPDRDSGRMGYVRHSWNPSNPYAVAGNFPIGTAPLLGGAAVLTLFLWLFFPAAARDALSSTAIMDAFAREDFLRAFSAVVNLVGTVLGKLTTPAALGSWGLWVFLYLVLCVGSHLAPSPQDYKGAGRGALAALLLLVAANWIFLFAGGEPGRLLQIGARVLGPAFALFLIAAVLNSGVAVLVLGVTGALDLIRAEGGKR